MAKSYIKSINIADFLKAGKNREERIENAVPYEIKPLSSYKANAIANALHPEAQNLIVSRIDDLGNDVRSYHLVSNMKYGEGKLAHFSAGQYLCIFLDIDGMKISRPYSIASSPKQRKNGEYVLTIKRVDGGLATNYIADNWQVGTEVVASSPIGTFTYEPLRDAKHIVGIAGGSGITPFLSLAKAISDGDEDCSLTLLYGAKTEKEILFKDTFQQIMDTCNKVKVIFVLSDEVNEKYEYGFITANLIKKYAPEGEYSIFICGPQGMYNFVDKEIGTLNIRKKFVRHELFGEYRYPKEDEAYPLGIDPSVKIFVKIRDKEYLITADTNDTILASLEKNGISAPARCRSGECGWCHTKLVKGTVYVPRSISDGRRMADYDYGYIHPCCTFPTSDLIIVVPYAK